MRTRVAMPRPSPIDRLRKICLALPDATEKQAWGEPTFRVRGRMFAMYANNHHGDGRIAVWCKAPLGFQSMIVGVAPKRFFVPPYVGVNGWVGVRLDLEVDWKEVASVVEQGYQMAAEKPPPRATRSKKSRAAPGVR
ncbi:MmcQ/YjbR family DNA-binding protein [Candidatus Binatus sp.]|uniref:MmcQ/YjbR family DNA-binding protein n=4 Tax=Candidatus Binatus sp. TaxID=2811406 RepID=UPI003C6ED9ED